MLLAVTHEALQSKWVAAEKKWACADDPEGNRIVPLLMEDVELSLRLKERGVICYIPSGIVVSHRRWEAMNFFANFIKVITLCFTYLVKRRLGLGDSRRKGFYERYYATSL